MKQRCNICEMFDCGEKCKCQCHFGATNKIRQDHDAEKGAQTVKSEEQAMEGLSALFG